MRRLIIPVSVAILLLTQCKKDNTENKNNTITGVPATRIATASNSIAIDDQDNKWFATDSGLYKFNNTDWTRFELPLSGLKINSLDIKNDTMLVSTMAGAFLVKIDGITISIIDEYNKSKTSIISDNVNASSFDPHNNIWFGTYLGLSFLNGSQWSSNRMINDNLQSEDHNISCIAYRQNDYFFGTLGHCLWHVQYDSETDAVSGASRMINMVNGDLTTDSIFSLYAGKDSSIWIGSRKGLTRNKGLTHIGSGAEFEYFLEGQRVYSILESANGRIWAGTREGLNVKENTDWTTFTTANGLLDNYVLSLAEDKNGGIWIGTRKGVSYYKNSTFTNY
jgi:ligand-binding sensor domain-containing protein